jgi:hypothetical protein
MKCIIYKILFNKQTSSMILLLPANKEVYNTSADPDY